MWEALVPGSTVVSVSNSGFAPKTVTVKPGDLVRWTFGGTRKHSVTNDQKLGAGGKPLFDSGARTTGQFDYAFVAAGTYTYRSTAAGDSKFAGSVAVPVVVTPSSGNTTTTFTVLWATANPPGYVFDVQIQFQKAGSKQWSAWRPFATGTTTRSGSLTATSGAGTYAIRARLHYATTGKASGWSPTVLVSIAP
jgi:plastocyanin